MVMLCGAEIIQRLNPCQEKKGKWNDVCTRWDLVCGRSSLLTDQSGEALSTYIVFMQVAGEQENNLPASSATRCDHQTRCS